MYYVLAGSKEPYRRMDDTPFIKGVSWWRGALISQSMPCPLEFLLETYISASPDHSTHIPAVLDSNPPLFRDDLVQAIRELGATNFDAYDATLTDPDDGKIHTNYKVLNIIGLVAAADMEKSDAIVHDNIPLIDVDFDKLVIDESKTHGLLIFRLAESSSTILIHEKLRDYLLTKGFTLNDMHFWDPKEIAI
jgi:hypothetical protein